VTAKTSVIGTKAKSIIAKVNKELGPGSVVLGDQMLAPPPRFTSGSLALDAILGGGWPANQFSELIGEASHGKTTIALQTIAANQKRDPNFVAVWIGAEDYIDSWAATQGVDNSRVIVINTNYMELAYETTLEFLASMEVDLVVIDSLPALVPMQEDEAESGTMAVGRGALLTNQFFRKAGASIKRSMVESQRPVACLVINQWRLMIGVQHGDPRTTPGGKGKDFAYFVRLDIRRSDWIEVKIEGAGKRRVGQTISCRTIKNKSAPPQQVAEFDFYFREGGEVPAGKIDFAREIVSLGIVTGILETTSAGRYEYHFKDDVLKWHGKDKVLDQIRQEPDLAEALTTEVLDLLVRT
jgi:recombination protein RecA